MKRIDMRVRGGLVAVLLLAGAGASAEDGPGAEGFDGLATASSTELAAARGADGNLTMVTSQQNFSSRVDGASFTADTIANGDINVGNNAFDGFSGVGMNVLNTGNSNAFSSGITTIINLQ